MMKTLLGIVLFALGLVGAMALSAGLLWANLEASLFGPATNAQDPLTTLQCPKIITPSESAIITAEITNPGEQERSFLTRAYISNGFVSLYREIEEVVPIASGETHTLSYEVEAGDAAWDTFVLARIYIGRRAPQPARTATCGILVFQPPLGMNGQQMIIASVVGSVLLMTAGVGTWLAANQPLTQKKSYQFATLLGTGIIGVLLIAFGLLSSSWVPGVLLFVLMVLLLLSLLATV